MMLIYSVITIVAVYLLMHIFIDSYTRNEVQNELKTHSDRNLRFALIEKKYGLATKDQEMALIARKMKIKPVYLFIDRKENRALIRVRENIE